MKKLYTMFSALALGVLMQANAQVDVTFKVDVTDYLTAKGTPLGANGVRIGGNFAAKGATLTDGTAMIDWSPSDATSAMSQEGATNIWSITVRFPTEGAGDSLQYKFVDNDWGTNEGKDGSNIATGGCGTDDGSGNINRALVIPTEAMMVTYCWDQCTSTCGTDGVSRVISEVGMHIFPNPASEISTVEYSLNKASNVTVEVYNSLGQLVLLNQAGKQNPGTFRYMLPVSSLSKGIYFVKLTAGSAVNTQRLSLTK